MMIKTRKMNKKQMNKETRNQDYMLNDTCLPQPLRHRTPIKNMRF